MIRTPEIHALSLWRNIATLSRPVLESSERQAAAETLWDIARFGATPRLKVRATEALTRFGFVVQHRPVMGGDGVA